MNRRTFLRAIPAAAAAVVIAPKVITRAADSGPVVYDTSQTMAANNLVGIVSRQSVLESMCINEDDDWLANGTYKVSEVSYNGTQMLRNDRILRITSEQTS